MGKARSELRQRLSPAPRQGWPAGVSGVRVLNGWRGVDLGQLWGWDVSPSWSSAVVSILVWGGRSSWPSGREDGGGSRGRAGERGVADQRALRPGAGVGVGEGGSGFSSGLPGPFSRASQCQMLQPP